MSILLPPTCDMDPCTPEGCFSLRHVLPGRVRHEDLTCSCKHLRRHKDSFHRLEHFQNIITSLWDVWNDRKQVQQILQFFANNRFMRDNRGCSPWRTWWGRIVFANCFRKWSCIPLLWFCPCIGLWLLHSPRLKMYKEICNRFNTWVQGYQAPPQDQWIPQQPIPFAPHEPKLAVSLHYRAFASAANRWQET